ncbi:MAG: PIG-L family deacetylase [Planctomycetota bacterium]
MLRQIARYCYRRLAPEGARSTLRAWLVFDEIDHPLQVITDFAKERVLVLAPHMDDEVIGCGGTLRKHVLAGTRVCVVYITDGRRGDPGIYHQGLDRQEITVRERLMTAAREEEAQRAASVLGIDDLRFLGEPDGRLKPHADLARHLAEILESERPGIVYLPSPLDQHRDHWATNVLFCRALGQLGRRPTWLEVCRGYEIWSPLLANRVADITDVQATKQQAIAEFRTQMNRSDYARAAAGLAMYRSIHVFHGQGYAEAFWEHVPEAYSELCRRLSKPQ